MASPLIGALASIVIDTVMAAARMAHDKGMGWHAWSAAGYRLYESRMCCNKHRLQPLHHHTLSNAGPRLTCCNRDKCYCCYGLQVVDEETCHN
jgi:hypothetical protein